MVTPRMFIVGDSVMVTPRMLIVGDSVMVTTFNVKR